MRGCGLPVHMTALHSSPVAALRGYSVWPTPLPHGGFCGGTISSIPSRRPTTPLIHSSPARHQNQPIDPPPPPSTSKLVD